jgi:hypothetical protein
MVRGALGASPLCCPAASAHAATPARTLGPPPPGPEHMRPPAGPPAAATQVLLPRRHHPMRDEAHRHPVHVGGRAAPQALPSRHHRRARCATRWRAPAGSAAAERALLPSARGNLCDGVLPARARVCVRAVLAHTGVLASNHQHLFCVRIDPAVDDARGGRDLVVAEVNAEPLPWGADNPDGERLELAAARACCLCGSERALCPASAAVGPGPDTCMACTSSVAQATPPPTHTHPPTHPPPPHTQPNMPRRQRVPRERDAAAEHARGDAHGGAGQGARVEDQKPGCHQPHHRGAREFQAHPHIKCVV